MAGGKQILVIDDELMVREMIADALAFAGYTVVTARNGVDGLKTLGLQPIDIVVTDILMPEGEGIETIFNIRKAYPEVRIIAVSGGFPQKSIDILDLARKCGAHATLAKPFEPEGLLAAVAEVDALPRRLAGSDETSRTTHPARTPAKVRSL